MHDFYIANNILVSPLIHVLTKAPIGVNSINPP